MTTLTFQERRRITKLWIDHARRSALSHLLHSPLLRWKYGGPTADELLLVPQELRTADPSFASEIEHGFFGLGGTVATLGQGSIFDIRPPSDVWNRGLHGFSWLRHLSASESPVARTFAQKTVADWIARYQKRSDAAWSPEVVGRRLFSWLANSDLILSNVNNAYYDRFTDSVGAQIIHLSARWRDAPGGLPRLVALNGLLTGTMCVAGHDSLQRSVVRELAAELRRQINDDGGHVSRNPAAPVELLLDLLPLETCFKARNRRLPRAIAETIPRMLAFLKYMRLGDGSLGRFNGMGATPFDAIATLVAYIDTGAPTQQTAPSSRYARLVGGDAILLADCGPPPEIEDASAACAGCLSFEFSSGSYPIFVNGGRPGPANHDSLAQSRATASHNTLVLGAKSSSRIIQHPILERLLGGAPIRLPESVKYSTLGDNDALLVEAQHDGYRGLFGLLHRRRLRLDKRGHWLAGVDNISSAGQHIRLPRDIPFSVHFHLSPDVLCDPDQAPETVEIVLADGAAWMFSCDDATVSIEDSIHFADRVGQVKAQQIVLRGSCFGDKTIKWRLRRSR